MKSRSVIDEQYYLNENNIFEEIEKSKEYIVKSEKAERIEQLLIDNCSEINKKQLCACMDAHHEKITIMMKETFKYAFSLANNLMVESLNRKVEKSK